jgi:glycoside/pentoside/hexuronide:cation symporter, GPH family
MLNQRTYTGGRVPFWEKVAFGVGGLCNDFMANTITVLAMPIFNIALGLDAALVGLAIAIPRFIDAMFDPFMGNISDNTRFKHGRRRPYMLLGSFLGGLLFSLLWMASPQWPQWLIFAYFSALAIVFYLAYSVFIVPYNGLASELTMDFDDRTRVMAYRAFFGSIAGLVTPWAYKLCFLEVFGGHELDGVKFVGVFFGVLIVLTGIVPSLFTVENLKAAAQPKIRILPALKETFKNRPFMILCGMVFFILMGLFLVQPMQLYIGIYYLFDGNKSEAAQLGGVAGTISALAALAATPVVAWLGTRLGKVRTLLLAQAILIAGSLLSWVFYTPANPYLSLVCMAMLSPAMACVWILLGSMMADTCDYDELNTGMRREGMYGAIYAWILKAGIALVVGASGFLVKVVGFDQNLPVQAPETIFWMRVLFAVAPVFFVVISILFTRLYPLREERLREIRGELDARAAAAGGAS